MKRYIVTADYYDWSGIKDHYYWIVDETTFYESKDTDGKVREFVPQITQDAADADFAGVVIHVYELGNEVTDKFLNHKDI